MTDKPSDDSSISDEDWEKFVQDAEQASTSAPKEPSARARMVTERLRQQEAKGELPAGWRTGPAWQEMNGRAARRRRLWAVLGVSLAVAVAVVAIRPSLIPGDPFGTSGEAEAVGASPLPAESAAPTAPPSAAADTPTRARPFAGSPAQRWAAGADAIEVPKAEAVGGVSAARIETALRLTKEFLVASNLDRDVLYGTEPRKALEVVDPLQKEYLAELRAGLRKPTVENDPKWTFTRFDPDEVELVGAEVKVRGRTTVEPDKGEKGRALIRADYTFVYPLAKKDGGQEVARTIVRRAIEVHVMDPVRFQVTEGRIWVTDVGSEIGNDACRAGDGFIRPKFEADLYASPEPSGAVVDPYDRSRSLEGADEECGTVSRT
ncbi:hypothetical protein [Streptomyces viridochromogenes]|uniref:hypothetical protein n=1 Tax=Streptomyces viridochromogenes TaxID=1938 RepID=UPI00069EC4B6|nr:hypothetical protein [Streptomyces viridochromogenes]KOG19456.1 hypothetical protein ADK36_19835 [Streptomyces viridochromogenes]KOG19954.1 hypothetical protein ADK35_19200 [Streptomyces viridochromogenes]